MTDTLEPPTVQMDRVDDAPPAEAPRSIIDELVARRDEMARTKHELVLDVPGYRLRGVERLAIRYRYPEAGWKQIADVEIRAAQSQAPDALLMAQVDVLVACCDEVLTRDDEGSLVRLEPDEDAPPLRFNQRLADLFRIDIPEGIRGKGRFVCRSLFSPEFPETGEWAGDLVLTGQSQDLQRWLQTIHAQVNEDFSGE